MCKHIDAKNLSKYRSAIMGLSICMIMFCHGTVNLSGTSGTVYSILMQFSQVGVDIFLLVSGLGCFYSLSKDNKLLSFYYKRGSRILIPYALVISLWAVLQVLLPVESSLVGFIYRYCLVTFFLRGELSAWYVAAVLVLYAIAPFLYKLIKKGKHYALVMIVLPIIIASVMHYSATVLDAEKIAYALKVVSEIFVIRIPVFVVGMLIGEKIICGNNPKISLKLVVGVFSVFIVLFLLNTLAFPGYKWFFSQWFISRFLYLFISVCVALFAACFFNKFANSKIHSVFLWLGSLTFEIYLIHEKILSATDKYLIGLTGSNIVDSVISNALAIAIAIVCGLLCHKIVEFILSKVKK